MAMMGKTGTGQVKILRTGYLILVNITVLMVLLLVLEVSLRVIGIKTIHEDNAAIRKTPGSQTFCEKAHKNDFITYDTFFTDRDGIFKARATADQVKNKLINADGFRGNAFEPADNGKISVLLLGDSFTWGSGSRPISECFADLIQQAGYHVYNGGIPGTDPVQYARIAEKYIPLLKPHLVCVILYLGNDIREAPDPLEARKNLHFPSNMGWLRGHDDRGNYFGSAAEAFAYFRKVYCGEYRGLKDFFTYRTVVGKIVYNTFNPQKLKNYKRKEWVGDCLRRIRESCQTNRSRFLLFLIPVTERIRDKRYSLKRNNHIFEGFIYYCPANLENEDYQKPPDMHFNNSGHRKFAEFVIDVMKKNFEHSETD